MASFVVGYNKVIEAKEPRFLILHGDEYALRKQIENVVVARLDSNQLSSVHGGDWVGLQRSVFVQSSLAGREKTIIVRQAEDVQSWDWLPIWFNKVRGCRIVVSGASSSLAKTLSERANTRGYSVDCSSPSSSNAQSKLAKLIAGWYDQSISQVNHLLNKQHWRVTECMQLLDKLKLLSLPLTSETIAQLGVVYDGKEEFVNALCTDNAVRAMTLIGRQKTSDYGSIVTELSAWLDELSRVKFSQAYMKSPHDIAFEIGVPKDRVLTLLHYSRRFDVERINRLALAIASADEGVALGYTQGLLEVLVSKW